LLQIISPFTSSAITGIATLFVIKNILLSKEKIINFKSILFLIAFVLITALTYSKEYTIFNSLTPMALMIIIFKYIYNINISKSLLVVSFSVIFYFIADSIIGSIILQFITVKEFRNNDILMIISNISVGLTIYQLSDIKIIKTSLNWFVEKIDNSKNYDKVIFLTILVLSWTSLVYELSINFNFKEEYIILMFAMVMFGILTTIYILEKINKQKISDKHDILLNYVQEFEEIVEKTQLANHEHKNQLIILRYMLENHKKAQEYIDNVIGEFNNLGEKYSNDFKNLPKGAVKGLLYYKLIVAEKMGIETISSINKSVYTTIKYMSLKDIKILTKLLGIFLDNAIEATKNCQNKNISLELYMIKDDLNIVISNTYCRKIACNDINRKGYSTKGQSRGYGLYFANKLTNQNNRYKIETTIKEQYFTQRIIYTETK